MVLLGFGEQGLGRIYMSVWRGGQSFAGESQRRGHLSSNSCLFYNMVHLRDSSEEGVVRTNILTQIG